MVKVTRLSNDLKFDRGYENDKFWMPKFTLIYIYIIITALAKLLKQSVIGRGDC